MKAYFSKLRPLAHLNQGLSLLLASILFVFANEAVKAGEIENLRTVALVAKEQVAAAETAAYAKKSELAKKYATALIGLEKSLASSGNLDAIIHLREEREAVEKSGSTTVHADKPIAELRDKYLKGIAVIDDEFKVARGKVAASFAKMTRDQETALTKAIKVEDALAVRKEGEKLLLEISGGVSSDSSAPGGSSLFKEDATKPANTAPASMESVFEEASKMAELKKIKPLEAIKVPVENPAVAAAPFDNKDRWYESLTVPMGKVKLKSPITIGDRAKKSRPFIIVPAGSSWSAGAAKSIDLSFGAFVATKSRFGGLSLNADHATEFYFQSCFFDDCRFIKGGVWYGGDLAGKFYFENCILKGSLAPKLNTVDTGFRIQNSVLMDMELPTYKFRNKKQPADFVNEKWLRVNNCRFIKCKVPLSFLMLTRDCIFETCTLVDDAEAFTSEETIDNPKPIEVTVYLKACRVSFGALPKNVILVQKADTELKGTAIPTQSSLVSLIGVGS